MTYDSPTVTALQSGATPFVNLLSVFGWDSAGDPDEWGFWDGASPITTNVVSGLDGSTDSRQYIGGGALIGIPPIVSGIGLDVRSVEFTLSQIHTSVRDMVFGARIRGALVEFHRGVRNPDTWALVSTPYPRFVGRVDTVDGEMGAAGSEGGIRLSCSPVSVDLTKQNLKGLKSNATQKKLHPGDTFRQYNGTVRPVWWGQQKGRRYR